jgi:hypothetical protein
MNTSDPVLYPQPAGTTEALRQEAARARADVAQSVELLAERMSPRQVLRPLVSVPVIAGVVVGAGVWTVMVSRRALRPVAWVGGLAAAALAFASARRAVAPPRPHRPPAPAPATRTGSNDVVDLLLDQHQQVLSAFDAVRMAKPGRDRLELFSSLVELLRRHERAEQHVVHPVAAGIAGQQTQARIAEEAAADRMLASLITKGVEDRTFDAGLARLRRMVADHAAHEETHEFPVLRDSLPATRLRELAGELLRTP